MITQRRQNLFLIAILPLALLQAAASPAAADWSGHWQENNQRSVPPPRSKVHVFRMNVDLQGSSLHVHSIVNNGHGERELDLTYELGGKEIVYTGTDGDECHSKAQLAGDEIVFTVVEHERGRLIPFTETWTLLDGGKSLQRVKVGSDQKEEPKSVTVLERLP